MKLFFSLMKRSFFRNISIRSMVVMVIAGLLMITTLGASYSENVNNALSKNLIRLHVVANSDAIEDQQLKLDVRDKVIAFMKNKFEESNEIGNARSTLQNNLDEIEAVAVNEIKRQGKSYPVKASFGVFPFPTKTYGDVALPAGNYQALRINIGIGEGKNWWCVLFPPLCFVDATHGKVPQDVKEDLKNILSEDEYDIITSVDSSKDVPIKIKFKIVEFFQQSKTKVFGFINSLFGSNE